MKVVHLSTYDLKGGAARSAYRLHQGLQRAGHQSTMLVKEKAGFDLNVDHFQPPTGFMTRLRRRMRRDTIRREFGRYRHIRPLGYELFSDDRTPFGETVVDQLPLCDVVNLHWIAGFLDYETFFLPVTGSKPVVWTLHDMNAFTGGCHYDDGCGRFKNSCGACPQLGSLVEQDLSRTVWERKHRVLAGVKSGALHVVTPSRWLAEEAKRSSLFAGLPTTVIPYGIDVRAFAPRDKAFARDVLGIPQEARLVLFLAEIVDNRRKGFSLLLEALPSCAKQVDRLLLVSLGSSPPKVETGAPWMHLGSISDDRFVSLVYSAADVFVLPSLQDNLPNTVLEAMACGVPVVSFDAGGTIDLVRPGITGYLAPAFRVPAFASAISELLNSPAKRDEMARNCRRIVLEEYPLELQAQRYSDLYKSLI